MATDSLFIHLIAQSELQAHQISPAMHTYVATGVTIPASASSFVLLLTDVLKCGNHSAHLQMHNLTEVPGPWRSFLTRKTIAGDKDESLTMILPPLPALSRSGPSKAGQCFHLRRITNREILRDIRFTKAAASILKSRLPEISRISGPS